MFEVMVEGNFSSAHAMRLKSGEREGLHGHNYVVQVFARGERLDEIGILIDFKDLKAAMNRVLSELDHQILNEIAPFADKRNTTVENIAAYILKEIARLVDSSQARICKVRVWDTDHSSATYELTAGE